MPSKMGVLSKLLGSLLVLAGCGDIKRNPDGSTELNYFYPDGKLKKQMTKRIGKNGATIEYWKFFSPDSVLVKEGENRGDKSEALWKFYYETGELKSETFFIDGVRNGDAKYYWPNGEVQGVGTFKNGELDGLWTAWYDNGQIERQGLMRMGKEEGEWKKWYRNGQLQMTAIYIDGEQVETKLHVAGSDSTDLN
jgi:antitoxin component YwqK of YwqJK toxin-antitoxin module